MKGFRGTLVFALIVAAVCGAAFFKYKHSEKESAEKSAAGQLFHDLKSGDVAEFTLANSKKNYTLKADGATAWQVTAPFTDRASLDAVHAELNGIFSQNVVSPDTDGITIDWAKYGLFEPEYTLTFKFNDGKQQILKVGRVRTYDQGYYFRRNDESTLLVGDKSWDALLAKDAETYRFNRPEIPETVIQALHINSTIKGHETNFEAILKDGEWSIVGKTDAKIQTGKVNELINSIRELTGEAVVSTTKERADLEKFGLMKPDLKIELDYPQVKGQEGKENHYIFVTTAKGKDKANEAYWYSSDNPAIFKIQTAKLAGIQKTPDDLRDMGFMFKFATTNATHLHYKHDATLVDLDKVNGEWKLHTADDKMKVNQADVNAFLAYLQSQQAAKYLKGHAVKTENDILVQDEKNQTLLHLEFGGQITEKLNEKAKIEYYAVKSSLASDVFAVTKSSLDELAKKKMVEPLAAVGSDKDDKKDLGRVTENKTVEGKPAAKAKR